MIRFLAGWVAGILLVFTVRRWLFLIAALLPPRRAPMASDVPDVLLLVPIRNEAPILPEFLAALAHLTYPAERLTRVLIDDGSSDGSAAILRAWASQNGAHVLSWAENVGKAAALNRALRQFPHGAVIVIYDADDLPDPQALYHLIQPFANPGVGAVSGRRMVSNALASPAASYTAFESLVHQRITLQAKDNLRLAPAVLGSNCAYRRAALTTFRAGALLEDTDLTLRLSREGWRIRFVREAVSYHRAPATIAGYWQQHTRWTRGFNDAASDHLWRTLTDTRLAWPLRLELMLFALGYLDRLALILAGLLSFHQRWLWRVIALHLLTPWFQLGAALRGESAALWRRLVWLPLFYAVDVAMAMAGTWQSLRHAPRIWEERQSRL